MTQSLDGSAIAHTASSLMAVESTGGNERAVMSQVAAWLEARGVAVERSTLPIASLTDDPFYSAEVTREDVDVLVARVGGDTGGRRLLLNAHVDVVAARDQDGWSDDPFVPRVVDGWLYGRGAADTKGGLAAAMHTLVGLASAPLSGAIILTPVVGEEDGGCGTLATLRSGLEADGAVVIEPTDLRWATASAGALSFRVTVPGRTAHGSVRHTGVSAIEKGWLIHQGILRLEADRARRLSHPLVDSGFPICMGRIEGGDHRCDEAAWLTLEGRMGFAPQEPVEVARAELVDAVAEVASCDDWLQDHPPTVEWIGAQWLGGETPVDDPLVTCVRALDPSIELVGMSYGCDLGLLRQAGGIPTVAFGPGAVADAHAPDERVEVAQLEACAHALHRLAMDYCR